MLKVKYFFINIVLFLILRSILNKNDGSKVNKEISIKSIINKILLSISRIENKCSDYLTNFFGGSFVIGEKIDTIQ